MCDCDLYFFSLLFFLGGEEFADYEEVAGDVDEHLCVGPASKSGNHDE